MNCEELKCKYCGKNVHRLANCIICPDCRIVLFSKKMDDASIYREIKQSLDSIQKHLDEINGSRLRPILQKDIYGEPLTESEQAIKTFAERFQDCRMTLNAFMNDHINLEDAAFRNNIFTLLDLSSKFNNVFDSECYIIEI